MKTCLGKKKTNSFAYVLKGILHAVNRETGGQVPVSDKMEYVISS